ncbi:unnamed protein product, partial [Staurois parvus]
GAPPKRGSSTLRTAPRIPIKDWHLLGVGVGERVPKFDRYPLPLPVLGDWKQKVSSLPPCSLLGHVTCPTIP